jgi:hypothetical protein
MSGLLVAPIVEGDGEIACIGRLLERIGKELLGGTSIKVADRPLLLARDKFLSPADLHAMLRIAAANLNDRRFQWMRGQGWHSLVLLLRDTDGEPPCLLGPKILEIAGSGPLQVDVACVVAHYEYETWFVASAEYLDQFLDLEGEPAPTDPEVRKFKKKWIEDRFRGEGWKTRVATGRHSFVPYKQTRDQLPMTEAMNLGVCRERCPSFDKLCRDLERFTNQENRV